MIKHRLDPIEVNQLAAQTLGAKLDLVQAPESGLAAGNIVPIPLGPGGLLLHGCMHGVRAISAQIDSHPGLKSKSGYGATRRRIMLPTQPVSLCWKKVRYWCVAGLTHKAGG